jgi:Tol biopolymer transport system component
MSTLRLALFATLAIAACDRSSSPVAPSSGSRSFAATDQSTGRIAFVSARDGNDEIYVINADGTGLTRLTDDPGSDFYPAWSPDGSRIAFTSSRDGHQNIYVMNADGSGVTQLTTSTTAYGSQAPAWCGTKIAYMSDAYIQAFPDVYVMNEDGTGQTRLTIGNATFDQYPTWSPTCAQIAFTQDPGGKDQISVMNADGTGVTTLTAGPGKNTRPAWSPDGTRIAFSSDRDSPINSTDIYVMNADGTQPTRVTVTASFHMYDFPAWSPDGTQLLFWASVAPTRGLYLVNADGSGLTLFSDSAGNRASWFGAAAPPLSTELLAR